MEYLSNYSAFLCIIYLESIFLFRMEAVTQIFHSKIGNLNTYSSPITEVVYNHFSLTD